MLSIGIIGCGTIGSALARAVDSRFRAQAVVSCLCDLEEEKARNLSRSLTSRPAVVGLNEVIERAELIIEAASAEISAPVVRDCLQKGKPVMAMSIGGILRSPELLSLAEEKKLGLYLPSGALAGLDAVKAASIGGISQVILTTRKPPASLRGAPYLLKHNIDLDGIERETVVFEGSADEAVNGFPRNINVSAVLSLAGIGAEKTRVKIVTSPEYRTNSHEIVVKGKFGSLHCRTDNLPSPENPRTSYLAILSAIATLKGIIGTVKIGT